eukprot:746603-Hanusia_phi.AAC.1
MACLAQDAITRRDKQKMLRNLLPFLANCSLHSTGRATLSSRGGPGSANPSSEGLLRISVRSGRSHAPGLG